MIALINFFASMFSGKSGWLILLLVLLGAGAALGFTLYRMQTRPENLPHLSILQEVRYMEELELVAYYSEHILPLGDPGETMKVVMDAAADSAKTYSEYQDAYRDHAMANAALQGAKVRLDSADAHLAVMRTTASRLQARLDILKLQEENLLNFLRATPAAWVDSIYGPSMAKAWSRFKSDHSAIQAKLPELKPQEVRRKTDEANDRFKEFVKEYRKRLQKETDNIEKALTDSLKQEGYKGLVNNVKGKTKDLEEALKTLRAKQSQHLGKAVYARTLRDSLANEVNIAETEWVSRTKLIAIIPATLSAYIDLETVYDTTIGNTVHIWADSIQLNHPIVSVDSTQHYRTSGGELAFGTNNGGFLYKVFDQVRLGIHGIEQEAIRQAKEAGIIDEACYAALDYFRSIFRPFDRDVVLHFRSGQCKCLETQTPTSPDSTAVSAAHSLPIQSSASWLEN